MTQRPGTPHVRFVVIDSSDLFRIFSYLNVGERPPKVAGYPAKGGLKVMVRSSGPGGDGGGSGVGGSAGFHVPLTGRGGVTFGLANLSGRDEDRLIFLLYYENLWYNLTRWTGEPAVDRASRRAATGPALRRRRGPRNASPASIGATRTRRVAKWRERGRPVAARVARLAASNGCISPCQLDYGTQCTYLLKLLDLDSS